MRGKTQFQLANILLPGFNLVGEASTDEAEKQKLMEMKRQLLLYRDPQLNRLERYLRNSQYSHLPEHQPRSLTNTIDDRQEQPKLVFPLPQMATGLVRDMVIGESSRLKFSHNTDPEKDKELTQFIEDIDLWGVVGYMIPLYMSLGSGFVRFFECDDGKIKLDTFNSKYCYPEFKDDGTLKSVLVRFVCWTGNFDQNGKKIFYWKQYFFGENVDIKYADVVYQKEMEQLPNFKEEERIEHGLGIVQGEWFKTSYSPSYQAEGDSFLKGALGLLDEFNYMASRKSSGVWYGIIPKLFLRGTSMEEVEDAEIDSAPAIQLEAPGNQADVHFIESAGRGIDQAEVHQERGFFMLQNVLKTIVMDPEKFAAYSQSGKAMEMLHKPVTDYIKCIKPRLKRGIKSLLFKILEVTKEVEINTEDLDCNWGPLFDSTMQDRTAIVQYTTTAVAGKTLSRESAVKHLTSIFDFDSVENEIQRIEKDSLDEMENELTFSGEQTKQQVDSELKMQKLGAKDGKKETKK